MTEDEYQNLLTELGKNKTIKCIEQLDIYKKALETSGYRIKFNNNGTYELVKK